MVVFLQITRKSKTALQSSKNVNRRLKIVEMIDDRIPPDGKERISTGEAIAGMILNGLGFSNRPMSLTPQFFENKPLEILFRPGVQPKDDMIGVDNSV